MLASSAATPRARPGAAWAAVCASPLGGLVGDRGRPVTAPPAAAGPTRRPPWNPEAPPPPGLWSGRLTSVISDARPWPLTQGWKTDLRKQPQQSGEKLHFQIGQHFWWAVRNHLGGLTCTCSLNPSQCFPPSPSGHPLHQGRCDAGSEICTAPRNPPNPPLTWSGEPQRTRT